MEARESKVMKISNEKTVSVNLLGGSNLYGKSIKNDDGSIEHSTITIHGEIVTLNVVNGDKYTMFRRNIIYINELDSANITFDERTYVP